MNSLLSLCQGAMDDRAMQGFAQLLEHICRLYTHGESSSVSENEAYDLAESALYVLGLSDTDESINEVEVLLASNDVVLVWTQQREALESRIPHVMQLRQEVVTTMPALRNIALRDTLLSLEHLPQLYDTFFAAHEVPCSIDYPLSTPVSDRLRGLDYVQAWLTQLQSEALFLAQFDLEEMEEYLDAWCPDYRGLLINLYDPIFEAWQNGMIERTS